MLKTIVNASGRVLYSFYNKKTKKLKQLEKENIYCSLLNDIVASITNDIDIIYDCFNNLNFENKINRHLLLNKNVLSIKPADSQLTPGLQFVDNLASIIRHHLVNDEFEKFYMLAKTIIKKV